jgi:site-specific DNA-methyltransferase (adenine-specific)
MWCFGSMRMFTDRWSEFAGWRLSQDVVWRKQMGTGLSRDRFRRVHEFVSHFYRGPWASVHHETPRVPHHGPNNGRRSKGGSKGAHLGEARTRQYVDDGTRLMTSVIEANNLHGWAVHPTEKPAVLLAPLIEYAVPPGGLVLDPFAGSASTLHTARQLGRRAIGIEANEEYCEKAAERLSVPDLFGGVAS